MYINVYIYKYICIHIYIYIKLLFDCPTVNLGALSRRQPHSPDVNLLITCGGTLKIDKEALT